MASYGECIQNVHLKHANILAYLGKLTAVDLGEWLSRRYKMLRRAFPIGFAQVFSAIIVKKKTLPEWAPTKTWLHVLSIIDRHAITCVDTLTIRLRSIKSSLPFSLPSTSLT